MAEVRRASAAKVAATANELEKAETPKSYVASLYPGRDTPLPEKLGESLDKLGSSLGMPVWLLLQDGDGYIDEITDLTAHMFRHERNLLEVSEPIALVINSPGGSARAAYAIARMICRRSGGFTAVVPDAAMSAATLLSLGATRILMADDACLGPLDAQVFDPDEEKQGSVLNEVQALERLRAYSLEAVDEAMQLLLGRTGKRIDSLLPHVLRFVAESMRPLLEKIDVVHYTERARILKVGEEYAVRLLRPKHPEPPDESRRDQARVIASSLVEKYPEHGFRIDREEARRIGLDVDSPNQEQADLLEIVWENLSGVTALGRLEGGTT